ncbi:hypothetical protein EAI_00205 [Harpegnathos saltator]|uniref:Uncharacterized protein n=1 Tax=Harpegnathos saltator TaxID=610380 RepID=E2BP80_HARSA|nr:hypothetical protein EAI_00205 [Harpegnathos saltator]
MDIMKTIFPYSGPCTSVYYNKIFHPNLCHVCKPTREMVNLITCNQCFLISYCSEDHKNLHLPQHRQLCTVIEKFLKNNPQRLDHRFRSDEWYGAKLQLFLIIAPDLGRKLQKYEIQMFTFARSCLICHQQTGVYSCKKCVSVDYCLEHKEEFERKHKRTSCNILILWLNLELSNVQYESKTSLSLKFMKFPDNDRPFNDTAKFIEHYVQDKKGIWYALDYIYTDYVSGPLSVYHGMYRAGLLDVLLTESICIIHVVAAGPIQRNGLSAWEILLHLFSNIQVLIIVLVGIDLQFEFGMQEICPRCVCNKKKLIYECCGMTYSDYMDNPIYRRANLIVGFQAELEFGSWNKCIQTMQSQECPVFLTHITLDAALGGVVKIRDVLGDDVRPFLIVKNKFRSLRPHRAVEEIYHLNSFLIVYKTLKNTDNATESS